jgi:phosphatidylcholine synthase
MILSEQAMVAMAARYAFLVHILTASGAAWAFLALQAAVERHWPAMFWWLGLALIVDAVDGPLARRLNVADRMPRWSGATLDLVVDFVTYVFVPAYAIASSGLLPDVLSWPAGCAIVVTGGLYFGDGDMKMEGNYFRGFPALWNAAAFYLILLGPPAWISALGVALLLIATFLPFAFVHPVRVTRWRSVTIAALIAWALLAILALVRDMAPGLWATLPLCLIALYMIAIGLLRPNGKPGGAAD